MSPSIRQNPWPALVLLLLAVPGLGLPARASQAATQDETPATAPAQSEELQAEEPQPEELQTEEIRVDWRALPQCSDTEVSLVAPDFANIGERLKLRAVLAGPGAFGGVTRWRLTDHGGGVVVTAEKLEVEYAYDRSGGHMVRLRVLVQGPDGELCQAAARATIRVKFVQEAKFDLTAECDPATAGEVFTCRASFPGDVSRTVTDWTFVPGETPVRGQEVQHIYDTPGTYTVFVEAKQLNSGCIPMGVCVDHVSVQIPVQPSEPE